jgi:F0F1-type ATP synthase assembly protein I
MNNKITEVVLVFWAIVAVASLRYALYISFTEGVDSGYSNFFIPGIAFMWFLFRWGMYKKMKNQGQK